MLTKTAFVQNVQRQFPELEITAALVMGPTCVAQMMNNMKNTATYVPIRSKLMSKMSFNVPDPTVNHGPANIPARNLVISSENTLSEAPPTQVNNRHSGVVIL